MQRKYGKCEYVGSTYRTPSSLKLLERRMGGRKIIENEAGKEFREPAMKGLMSYAKGAWHLSSRLLDTTKKIFIMEVIGFYFCFGKIMLGLLWKMDGGIRSGVGLEGYRSVRRLRNKPGERRQLVEL